MKTGKNMSRLPRFGPGTKARRGADPIPSTPREILELLLAAPRRFLSL